MSLDWQDGAQGVLVAAGKRLEYQCFGPAPDQHPVIVLLHEGLGCVALWRDFPQRLVRATGRSVFAFSRAGYGRSDPAELPRPLDYMTREAVDVLPLVLDQLGAAQVVLLGHSDGATIAAIHAGLVDDPRRRGAILMAPHFFTETFGLKSIAAARMAFEATDMSAKLAKYHNDAAHTFSGWAESWLNPDFTRWNVEDVLDSVTVPLLAIQGEADPYGTLRQVEVIAQRSQGHVESLILPGIAHAPHLECSEAVTERISAFLEKYEL